MLLLSPLTWDHYLMLLALPITVIWQRWPRGGWGREILVLLLLICWEPLRAMEHVLILLDCRRSQSSGQWLATSLETLTALSLPCYALLGLFLMALLARCSSDGLELGRSTASSGVTAA